MQKQKNIILISTIIILVIAVIAISSFFAYQYFLNKTQSEYKTADWQTYTNTQYGFSFQYPSDMNLDVTTAGAVVLTKQNAPESPGGKAVDFSVSACNLSYQSCVTKKQNFDQTTAFYGATQNVVFSIAGVSGSQWVLGAAQYAYTAGIEANGIFYVFGSNVDDYNTRYPNSMSNADVKAIFDSFKLTNPPNNQTADWKTYSGYGISFKYPDVKEWGNPQINTYGSKTSISFGGYWSVDIMSNYNNETGKMQTFDEFVQSRLDGMKVLGGPPYDITEKDVSGMVSVNGIRGKIITYRNKGSNPNFDIYYPMSENSTIMFENNNNSVSDDIFNKILSTFKITK